VLLSQRDASLLLSEGAGAWDELAGAGALRIDAHDVVAAAESLHLALSASPAARAARAETLREVVARRTPATWLADQLAHA
jgi:trehalose-6-phosphate synthase